jgi:flavin reductase (DIM6/NTAB) family NADH-FMN oxidoreductase RutF
VYYEPQARDRDVLPHDPFKAIVAPRPVGWVSTAGPDGEINLAPYSFFNAVCDRPPIVMFSSAGRKDSMTFAGSGGEFVWNLATYALHEQMNLTSAVLPRGSNEFEHAGLTMAPCHVVAPPRVAESPASLECKVLSITELHDLDGASTDHHLVLGQVVGVHLADEAIVDGRFDTAGVRPVARCGYKGDYAVVTELFEMFRPA